MARFMLFARARRGIRRVGEKFMLGGAVARWFATQLAHLRGQSTPLEKLLKKIGVILLESSQRAFRDQRFGDIQWPHRYPRTPDPFVNIAGAVDDLAKGPRIKNRRFDRRPALMDTGALLRSLRDQRAARTSGLTVEVGSTVKYAGVHQWGGVTTKTVTPVVKQNLAKYLRGQRVSRDRAERAAMRGQPGAVGKAAGTSLRLAAVRKRMGFLFSPSVSRLKTLVAQRPFVGITDDAERKIVALIETTLGRRR